MNIVKWTVKSATALMMKGLQGKMLVKAAHEVIPRDQLNEKKFSRGDWVAYHAKIDDADLLQRIFLINRKIFNFAQVHLLKLQ